MTLKFRNIDATPAHLVETWGVEGILTALERGNLNHWNKVLVAAKAKPGVRRELNQALKLCPNAAVVRWFGWQLEEASPEQQVALRLKQLRLEARLSQREFAAMLGTSSSRLSTYLSGKVMPGADFMYRAEAVSRARL